MNTVGLYLHIPFCKSKCRYCDFCSLPTPRPETVDAYVAALAAEITEGSRCLTELYGTMPTVDTVFFGGGTPTTLTLPQFSRLMTALHHAFSIAPEAEITTECNPATADRAYFSQLRSLGLNRISIGAQSMNDRELKALGRLHKAQDVVTCVEDARAAGFENVSLDLMLGIPESTPESLADTVKATLALAPQHLSFYGLQIEEGTYFARHQASLALPDEDTVAQMYLDTTATLRDHGYLSYEISNAARPGFECRHNLKYWLRQDYLGLGAAAHSCVGNTRFANTASVTEYLAGTRQVSYERISPHDILCEELMLGMRLAQGVDFAPLLLRYGQEAETLKTALSEYISLGLVAACGTRLAFTEQGRYVSNTILAQVLDFEGEG